MPPSTAGPLSQSYSCTVEGGSTTHVGLSSSSNAADLKFAQLSPPYHPSRSQWLPRGGTALLQHPLHPFLQLPCALHRVEGCSFARLWSFFPQLRMCPAPCLQTAMSEEVVDIISCGVCAQLSALSCGVQTLPHLV